MSESQKWEYIVFDVDSKTPFQLQGELNSFGLLGWELVSVDSTPYATRFFFKRPKELYVPSAVLTESAKDSTVTKKKEPRK